VQKINKKDGFTLLELLLVIGIIGILSGIVVVALNPSNQMLKAKDSRRRHDVNELQKALTQYLIDNGEYPTEIPEGEENSVKICREGESDSSCINLTALAGEYIAEMPLDTIETNTLHSGYEAYIDGETPIVKAIYLGRSSMPTLGYTEATPGESCLNILDTNNSIGDEIYWIDPDGSGGEAAFQVSCDMTTDGGGWTIISHDSEDRYEVNGCDVPRCFEKNINYDIAMTNILNIISVSTDVEQYLYCQCYGSVIKHGGLDYSAWYSRDSTMMTMWPNGSANCLINDSVWRADGGVISDSINLPITEVKSGDTGDSNEIGFMTIGQLRMH
jgi:prepilin-type N-terminal cleavage/methylation domain-containing protein